MSATPIMKTSPQETRWFYCGPDNETYGPYSPKDMMLWTQSGYFNESLLVRTEHETQYHTLGEWNRLCGGKAPFTLNVFSMDSLMQQLNQVRPPVMMMPPPFPQAVRFPFQMHPGGPLAPMLSHGGAPAANGLHQLHSQPTSDQGLESGSLPNTPESDQEMRRATVSQANQLMALLNVQNNLPPAPELTASSTQTDKPQIRDAMTQTAPLILPTKLIANFLSELMGQTVHLT